MKTSRRKSTAGSVLVNLAGRSLLAAAAFALLGSGTVDADQFGGWSLIGDTNNVNDTSGYGAVDYEYSIANFEVSEDDWDSAGLSGGSSGSDAPMVNISLNDAKKYANYLTEQANGSSSDYNLYSSDGTGAGSYTRADAISDGITVYGVPTEDEWYKAAYYNVSEEKYYDYAIPDSELVNLGSGLVPPEGSEGTANDGWNYNNTTGGIEDVGFSSLEQNGTRDMMGNVFEWQEDVVLRGGGYSSPTNIVDSSWRNALDDSSGDWPHVGFRVAAIPEPVSGELFVLVVGLLWFVRRRARA